MCEKLFMQTTQMDRQWQNADGIQLGHFLIVYTFHFDFLNWIMRTRGWQYFTRAVRTQAKDGSYKSGGCGITCTHRTISSIHHALNWIMMLATWYVMRSKKSSLEMVFNEVDGLRSKWDLIRISGVWQKNHENRKVQNSHDMTITMFCQLIFLIDSFQSDRAKFREPEHKLQL